MELIVNGIIYRAGDWLRDLREGAPKEPTVIVSPFIDGGNTHWVLRYPDMSHDVLAETELVALIETGVYEYMTKPLYLVGQRFRNRFTESFVFILGISPLKSEVSGGYVYFAQKYTPTSGEDYEAMTESDVTAYFEQEGVDSTL